MKIALGLMVAAGLLHAAPVLARSPLPPPLNGRWTLDVSRLPMPPEQRPRSVTFTFAIVGPDKWTSHVDIVAADGKETHSVATYTVDGTAGPVEGSPEADMAAFTMPRPDVLIMALSKGGVPSSIRVITLSGDLNSYTETATYFGRDGKPVMRPAYFNRIR